MYDKLLERPKNSLKVVILTVLVYYSERLPIKISQGKRLIGQSLEKFLMPNLQLSSPGGVTDSVDSAMMCGSVYRVMPTRAAHLSLDVNTFYWDLVM